LERLTADEVRDIRRLLKMTRRQLAERLSVSVYTVESWEVGRRACFGPAARLLRMWETLR
jgi:DNA-binding transcriptional regulator YiaG